MSGKTYGIFTAAALLAATLGTAADLPVSAPAPAASPGVSSANEPNLTGKTYEYNYGKNIYVVTFPAANTVRHVGIKGGIKGSAVEAAYWLHKVGDNLYFIAWQGPDGQHSTQLLDFNNMKVYSFEFADTAVQPAAGTIRRL